LFAAEHLNYLRDVCTSRWMIEWHWDGLLFSQLDLVQGESTVKGIGGLEMEMVSDGAKEDLLRVV